MKRFSYKDRNFKTQLSVLYNRPIYPPEIEASVASIISGIRERGDEAISDYARKFDGVEIAPQAFRLTDDELADLRSKCPADNRRAIDLAFANIKAFARLTKPNNRTFSPRRGVVVGERFNPLDRVGVYIPGGTAPLVSTILHTAGIASVAGVREIVATTPAKGIHPETAYAMKVAGVKEVYRLGGAYGVAALALGTKTIRPVEKIVGPGNAYVTAAKKLLYGAVAIDLVAGPSEILVIADKRSNPSFVAADLLSQAEHGSGLEQSVLVSDSKSMLDAVEQELAVQKKRLARIETVDKVIANGMFFILTESLEQACEIASSYAPEHLELQIENAERYVKLIRAAGAVFIGDWTPESCGDFCAGPSHVLPTAGSARKFNGLETASFMRRTSFAKYTSKALQREIGTIEQFGKMEQLDAHAYAGTVRRDKI